MDNTYRHALVVTASTIVQDATTMYQKKYDATTNFKASKFERKCNLIK